MRTSGRSGKSHFGARVFIKNTLALFFMAALCQSMGYGQDIADTTARSPADTSEIEVDTVEIKDPSIKDPKTATILSAIFPGAGQAYNEKVWKIPILYGGIITTAYFVEFNNRRYQKFKTALKVVRDPSLGANPFPSLNEDGIIRNVDYWRRNRDLCYLIFGVIYALGIVDAQVDAHLSGFDVSDDLSLHIEPAYETMTAGSEAIGLSVKLKF